MKPKMIGDKWYIEVYTKEFGNILLLDDSGFPNAREFNTEDDAKDYIKKVDNNKGLN